MFSFAGVKPPVARPDCWIADSRRMFALFHCCRLLPKADAQVRVERIVLVERVDDRRVLTGLAEEPRLLGRHRLVGSGALGR
jgi:hypothetical protein